MPDLDTLMADLRQAQAEAEAARDAALAAAHRHQGAVEAFAAVLARLLAPEPGAARVREYMTDLNPEIPPAEEEVPA